jgi:hypothetical protein
MVNRIAVPSVIGGLPAWVGQASGGSISGATGCSHGPSPVPWRQVVVVVVVTSGR